MLRQVSQIASESSSSSSCCSVAVIAQHKHKTIRAVHNALFSAVWQLRNQLTTHCCAICGKPQCNPSIRVFMFYMFHCCACQDDWMSHCNTEQIQAMALSSTRSPSPTFVWCKFATAFKDIALNCSCGIAMHTLRAYGAAWCNTMTMFENTSSLPIQSRHLVHGLAVAEFHVRHTTGGWHLSNQYLSRCLLSLWPYCTALT